MAWKVSYSPSYKLISEIMDSSFLANVVHNNFHDSEAIFKPFFKAGAEFLAMNPKTKTTTVNGSLYVSLLSLTAYKRSNDTSSNNCLGFLYTPG